MSKSIIGPDKLFRMSMLLDTYGSLLTEKQRQFITLHYEQDMSFGEIAAMNNVSRQAIHDSVKHAEATLEELESKLMLVSQSFRVDQRRELADRLLSLKQRIRQTGIIYNTEWIQQELTETVEFMLGRQESDEDIDETDAESEMMQ